jgi:DNA polymerase-3 subunit beta
VATDGHRLALIDFPKASAKTAMPDVLVPKKAIAEILKMDGTGEEADLSIRHSENHLLFSVGGRQLIARLLDVNFPDYEKILSKNNDRVAKVPTAATQAAIRRVALFSSERSRGVKLTFEKNSLTVASASQELGEGTETLDVSFDGEPLSIGLNAQYVLDFFEEAETETVRLELKDENTQCLCQPEGGIEGASRYLYVVMPMRL